jgi:glycosyltransferase involved in cell wall biosynthesis
MKTKTILATCYAVNPYKGSEDGMGWNYVNQIARFNKVIAITRENNQAHIEKFMGENPSELYENITFLYFDLPYWMRFWKKRSRGAMLYYYMWQKGIISFIKKQNYSYDIVHNLNFHNDWTPTFLYQLNKPMVWGPIGHHPIIPRQYLKLYAIKYFYIDRATWVIKKLFWKVSFSLKKSVKNANHIICMNTGVSKSINLKNACFSIQPSVASEDFFDGKIKSTENFNIISVGRFVPLKGFDLTLLSFIKFIHTLPTQERKNSKLTLVGTGPEKELYIKIIKENDAANYIEIIEWIDRKELMKLYKEASIFLFPSHEGAGMVVAEALSFGLPVLCLNNEGPGEFITQECGFIVNQLDYFNTVSQLKNAILNLYSDRNLLFKMSINARKHYEENFTWNSRGNHLKEIYNKL